MGIKLAAGRSVHVSQISAGLESLAGDVQASEDQMFKEVIASYKEKFPMCDLSHMKMLVSATPRNHDGDAKTEQSEIIKYTGSWTKLDTIVINPDMKKAIEFYKVEGKTTEEQMKRQAIAHELAHELWYYGMDERYRYRILRKAQDLKFDTPYLHHIGDDEPDQELFCEYMAYRVTGIWIKV